MNKEDRHISKKDEVLMQQNPDGDPGFDPDHNKRVIAETIRKQALNAARKKREHVEGVRERSAAVAQFMSQEGNNNVIDYFGRKEAARLRGMDFLEDLKKRAAENGGSPFVRKETS